jgi:hypothetical protein
MDREHRACSVANCPLPATGFDEGAAGPWIVRIYYCHEHAREREKGTPVGGLSIDGARVDFVARETSEPKTGADMRAIGPQ